MYINAIDAGTVTLRGTLHGTPSSFASSNTAFSLQDGIGIGVINLSMTPSAWPVGKLPGYDDGSPALRVHCDAQAERVARTNSDTTPVTIAMSEWRNLRIGGPLFTEAVTGRQPRLRVQTSKTNPYTRFVGAAPLFGQSESRLSLDAAAAGLDIGPANVTLAVVAWTSQTTPAHLVGRWTGPANADRSWRIAYIPTTSPKPVVRVEFARNLFISQLDAPVDNLANRTLIVYRASGGPSAVREIWINGNLATTGGPAPFGINNTANKNLTIGARATDNNDPPTTWTDFLNTEFPPPASPLTEVPGSVDQVAIYTERLTDGQLSLVFHEMARRATIEIGRPITQPDPATQAYGPENPASERRLVCSRSRLQRTSRHLGANSDKRHLHTKSPDPRSTPCPALHSRPRYDLPPES
ncbi:MAG: hypothetical protein KF902_09945 [Phycisphaeraceae bacterium]|nr:hypothetical protein [Phycisphaeraceae bacterium]